MVQVTRKEQKAGRNCCDKMFLTTEATVQGNILVIANNTIHYQLTTIQVRIRLLKAELLKLIAGMQSKGYPISNQ